MVNAAPGGVNSQIAEWLGQELPEVGREIGAPVAFLPAGLNDQDYKARVALDIKGGRGADVIAIDQFWVPEFAAAGFIMPIDRYLADWPTRAQFFAPIQRMGSFGGHDYMVVWDADVRMVFYNRALFRQAGIELPWQPRSWDDLLAAGRKLKAACPGVTPLQIDAGTAMDEAATMQGFFMVLLGAGGRLYDPDRDCWIASGQALERTADFYRRIYQTEHLADPDLQISPKAREKSFDLFHREKIAVYVESTWFYSSVLGPNNKSWGIPDRDTRIGWARMPGGGQPGDPEFVSVSGGNGLIINPHGKDPDRAWRLVAALNQLDRQQRLFALKPFTPTRQDLAALPEVQAQTFTAAAAAEVMPYTSFRPALREYPEISFHVQFLTERLATGQLDVPAALAEYRKAVANVVGDDRVCKP
jgi:multiple sugar transport system substrate-binding protein